MKSCARLTGVTVDTHRGHEGESKAQWAHKDYYHSLLSPVDLHYIDMIYIFIGGKG